MRTDLVADRALRQVRLARAARVKLPGRAAARTTDHSGME
jgi:hypothetical protein